MLPLLVALLLSVLLCRLAIWLSRRLHFLDRPGARKVQEEAVPLLGGAAIFLALLGGLAAAGLAIGSIAEGDTLLLRWLGAGLWLLIVGLIDDRRALGPLTRLAAQALAVLVFLPELGAWMPFAPVAILVGGVWLLGLINSFNFLDNMDGVAGSCGTVSAVALALLFSIGGEAWPAAGMFALAGALLGFLSWNRPPARLYMGDAGSTFLGLSFGVFALLAVIRVGLSPWLAPLLLAVPLFDTATVFWIRWREGRPIWVGDRRHASHRMVERGAGIGRTVLVLALWAVLAAAAAILLRHARTLAPFALGAALAVALPLFAWERGRESSRASGSESSKESTAEGRRASIR